MKTNTTLYVTMVLLGMLWNMTSLAQNAREGVQNTQQIVTGKKALNRDQEELRNFKKKVAQFNTAYKNDKNIRANEIKLKLVNDMNREVRQSAAKAEQARTEIAQSSAEIRTDNREIRRDKKDSRRTKHDRKDDKKDLARDRYNRRDDKRDRKDDAHDLEDRITQHERQQYILNAVELYEFDFATRHEKNTYHKQLINDFVTTMERDIEATKKELKEDKAERREDRRERRDDKKERKEKRRRG